MMKEAEAESPVDSISVCEGGGYVGNSHLSPAEALLLEEYREGTQTHLDHLPDLLRVFTGLTGRISWAHAWPCDWRERDLPIAFPFCRCLISRTPGSVARCRQCARQHLRLTLTSGPKGHRFTCFHGVHNCWQPIIVRRRIVGLAFVQALDIRAGRRYVWKENGPSRRACRAARRMSRSEFNRSSKLLQLIIEHAESLTLADLRKAELNKTRQALLEMQTVATHLRAVFNRLIPGVNRTLPVLQPEGHSGQLVRGLLDFVARDYALPITLKQCAMLLGLNPAYLCNLFSHHVGLPFKSYLTEVRMEKARELLGDCRLNISEVGAAVGYASENRFRIAFKKVTGLSPRLWRETFTIKTPSSIS